MAEVASAYVALIPSFKGVQKAIENEVGVQENVQTALMRELQLEESKWKSMQTPANLERRLLSHGMAMTSPMSGQRVAMSGRTHQGAAGETPAVAAN